MFTAGFAVFPVGLDALQQANYGRLITLSYLLPATNTYLIGMGIVAGGLGELIFDHRRSGLNTATYIATLILSGLFLIVGGFLYASNKSEAAPGILFPLAYLGGSIIVSGLSVTVAGRS